MSGYLGGLNSYLLSSNFGSLIIYELLITVKTEVPNHKPTTGLVKSIRLIADQLEYHEKEIGGIKDDIHEIKDYVSNLEAKITSIDENYYSISGYCALYAIPCPLDKAKMPLRKVINSIRL